MEAPIAEGQVLGTMTLSYDGKEYATVDLLANNAVEASRLLVFWRDVKELFSRTSVKLAAVVLLDRAGKIKRTGLPATPDPVGTGVPDGPSLARKP